MIGSVTTGVDPEANEICIDSGGLSENTYSARHEKGRYLLSLAVSAYPQLVSSGLFEKADIIGVTRKDGRSYFEDTVSITFPGPPEAELREEFGIPDEVNCFDCHTLKIGLESGIRFCKVYDAEFWRHPLPSMPSGWRLAHRFGIGLHFGSTRHEMIRDVYFFHHDMTHVFRHFGLELPQTLVSEPPGCIKLFGVTYHLGQDMRILKAKRYWYPNDPLLEKIEGI